MAALVLTDGWRAGMVELVAAHTASYGYSPLKRPARCAEGHLM